jgi:putative membrane protein
MTTPPELIAFVAGYPLLLAHLGVALGGFFIWSVIYSICSRGREISQIRDGNSASAILYGVTLLSIALPMAAVIAASTGIIDMAVWCAATGLVQLTLFALVDLVLAGLAARVRDEADVSAAVLLGAARLAMAWMFAAALKV